MSKQILLLAGAALLFAGAAQACAPEAEADQEYSTIAQKEAPAPTASVAAASAAQSEVAKEAEQELSPDARPAYLNGGHFGGE